MAWLNRKFFTNTNDLAKYKKSLEEKKHMKEKMEHESKKNQEGLDSWLPKEPKPKKYTGGIIIK